MASENIEELLFFDTFSHDSSEEINLDLVQFPKPVLISEIRIIPLGARVQADFPGGFRLGATNPSQFHIEFFVNDLSKPGASTFESVGGLEYRENVDIQLECGQRKIPTDGLVLRGWYTTITLAVYGVLSKGIQPPVPPVPVPDRRPGDIPASAATAEWVQQHAQVTDHGQDNNLYIDPSYNYPPEYQPPPPEHPYVEGWPGPNVPPPAVPLPHNDGYSQPPPKEYDAQPAWDPVRNDSKSWDQHPPKEKDSKPDHTSSPSRSLPGEPPRDWGDKRDDRDEKDKPRSRDDRDKYWDESSDIRDDRERSKARDDRRDKDLDDRGRDRRSEKDREWRRRDDDDRDRYRDRDKDRKEREGSAKDECSRDRGIRDERSRLKDRERERSNLRDDRTSGGNSRSRRDRDRSLDRGSWHDRNVDSSESRSRSSKNYRENSWEKEDRRERERSPCSDNSSYRRRPRSPPSRSPKRPYTPTERFWSPEQREAEYNSPNNRPVSLEPHEERRRSPPPGLSPSKSKVSENLKIETAPALSVQTPLLSPAKYPRTPVRSQSPAYVHSPLAQDEPSLDDEQFEPILSDEDIIDESDSQYQDIDYDFPDDMEEVVKPFNPFTFQVQPLEYFLDPSLTACEKEKKYASKSKTALKSPELNQIRSITDGVKIDDKSNIKEDWVQAVESLLPLLEKGLARVDQADPLIQTLVSWVDVGLNLDLALVHSQPGFKVRHVKSGIRLTEALCWCGSPFAENLVTRESVQQKLLQLFHKDYMALSIKLMILKALDSTFINEKSIKFFLREKFLLGNGEVLTGYQHLFKMLEGKQSVRVKFSLTSLIKKIHIYEMLENLKGAVENSMKTVAEAEWERDVTMYLKEIERIYAEGDLLISQPKRFLPVQSQFEINVASPSTYVFLYKYFKSNKLLEIFLLLLANRKTNPSITTTVQNLMKAFSERQDGLLFLSSNPEVTNSILKILCCQTAEEYIEVIPGTTVYFGVEITCRLQTLQLLDKLFFCDKSEESNELFDLVHELYCVSFTPIGKIQVAFVLSLTDNVQILLNVIERSDKKSAVRNYLYDILILIVKYSDDVTFLKKYGRGLLELAEEDKQNHLYDVVQWLKPLETDNIISYEDIGPLCDVLKKYTNLDNCATLPGDLITCVRILKYLAIPKNENDLSVQTCDEEYLELKYKYVVLQLYSLDSLTYLNTILCKILEYYEQPFVHSINLLTLQGTNLLSFIEPCVMLMRRMLTYVISVRNNEYRDLTHVNTLIEVFTLMQAVPPNAECYLISQKICRDIVETLLAYTQPVAAENASESETFTKSLWTLMISEVLKYITKSSFTFIPGFLLLSELLPLPIPIPSKHDLTKTEINQIINSRKLWSAHLHTLSPIIHDLIATMAGSSYAPLLQLVRRVCLQLADLAAPTALVICKSILDPLLSTLQKPPVPNQQGVVWEIPCTPHALRLLNFLACLVSHASIKAAVLSLLTANPSGKDDRFLTLVNGFSTVLRTPSSVVTHAQVQEHVILIIQALLDSDVTLVPVSSIEAKEDVSVNDTFLVNALPSRDLLGTLITGLLDHVATPENSFITILSALKAFVLLTEHDYGFYHLKTCIDSKNESVWSLLIKICNGISRENNECLTVLCTTVELFRELVTIGEEVEVAGLTPRTIAMTVPELAVILKWDWEDTEKPHPILHLESLLKEWSATDESFVSLCENLEDFVKLLNAEGTEKPVENKVETIEPLLPSAMPLMTQFSSRPVYIIGEIEDKRLSSVYWLSPPSCDDSDQEMDQIQCDLMELTSSFLPDLHLPHEVERICMLKSTDDEEDPKKPIASKYHFTGVRTRRPFITPMRGRGIGRAAPQRGDLFRSRPPNTSRPPSLHVDDFVALETCGQQPTGPTGYNKISMRAVKDILSSRTRGRGRAYSSERGRFFGAQTYPRRDSPRGVLRGRGSWLQHDDVSSSRVFHPAERLGLRGESSLGRFLGRGRAVASWNTRSEQFGGMPIRGVRKEPTRHSRTFSR